MTTELSKNDSVPVVFNFKNGWTDSSISKKTKVKAALLVALLPIFLVFSFVSILITPFLILIGFGGISFRTKIDSQ